MSTLIRHLPIEKLPEGFTITDSNLAKIYSKLIIGKRFVIKAGEKSKSIENYSKILNHLGNEKTIVAFGGGVVGDLAGFAASTYKRGINLIQIPTTLLSMADSAIGGKNGVNIGGKKNYAGTIYQPKEILIDARFLKTLPEKEFRNGIAEIVKYAHIFGSPSMKRVKDKISPSDLDIEKIILQCYKSKLEAIKSDKFDKSFRHVLNFGHTIGHAIELLCNLSHGEAVSIGMAIEIEIARRLGIADGKEVEDLKFALKANNLPTELPKNASPEKIINLIKMDKKGEFIFALDKANFSIKVDEKIVREALKQAQ